VDFYPNGGHVQPHCEGKCLALAAFDAPHRAAVPKAASYSEFLTGRFTGHIFDVTCSHYAALDYFMTSITEHDHCLFLAKKCRDLEAAEKGECAEDGVLVDGLLQLHVPGARHLPPRDQERVSVLLKLHSVTFCHVLDAPHHDWTSCR